MLVILHKAEGIIAMRAESIENTRCYEGRIIVVRRNAFRNARFAMLLAALAFGVVITSGCASTRQTNLWVDPSYHATPMTKILVIAMRKDQIRRRMWEDAIVAALTRKEHAGTAAVPSYLLFPSDLPDTLAMSEKIIEEGIDGVLLVANARHDTLTSDFPGYTANELVTTYSRRWNIYVTRYEDVYHPGYTETETALSVRTDLLVSQEDGKLVWSLTSQSVDPTSVDQFMSSVANRVGDQLKKQRFIY
jgi:hypothetical protein